MIQTNQPDKCILQGLRKPICNRIISEIDEKGGLNHLQFGFRRGMQTLDVLERGGLRDGNVGYRKCF